MYIYIYIIYMVLMHSVIMFVASMTRTKGSNKKKAGPPDDSEESI